MKILLVEDDQMLATALSTALVQEGYSVQTTSAGATVATAVYEFEPELIVLDLGLPDMDGIDVLQQVRKAQQSLPILILTARDTVYDKVDALDKGADDYLAKPFNMQELLARIRVLARRIGINATNFIQHGGLSLELTSQTVKLDHQDLNLTQKEFLILKALMQNTGRVLTKEMIERKLYDWREEISSNAIEVHMSNLRKKLPDQYIKTIRGVGYTITSIHD